MAVGTEWRAAMPLPVMKSKYIFVGIEIELDSRKKNKTMANFNVIIGPVESEHRFSEVMHQF